MKKRSRPSSPGSGSGSGDDDFAKLVGDVRPLSGRARVPREKAPPAAAPRRTDAARERSEEVALEGHAPGLDGKLLRRLGRGEPAVEAELDVHGRTRDAAAREVRAFLGVSVAAGRRAVRIVHGRGLHSAGGEAVLRTEVARCLHEAIAAGDVLAFRPAPPEAGGLGAVHVLLRVRIKRR